MVVDRSLSSRLLGLVVHTVIAVVLITTIFPVLNILSNSVSETYHIIAGSVSFFPVGFSLRHYTILFSDPMIPRSFFNSVAITLLGTEVNVAFTVTMASATVGEMEVATITALTYDLNANEPKAVMDIRTEILRDQFGLEYEWVYVPSGDVDTKLPVMFASGDFPEQLQMNWNWNVSPQRVMMLNHIPGGFFVAVDDYLDRMPNYQAQWTDADWAFMRSLMSAGDGKMYVLPTKYPWPLDRGYMYNETEFNKLGLQFPSTTDELLEVLRAFKVEYPDSVLWTHKWGWPGSATRAPWRSPPASKAKRSAGWMASRCTRTPSRHRGTRMPSTP